MKATVVYDGKYPVRGYNERGNETRFEPSPDHGGSGNTAAPMEVFLQAAMACSMMDVVSILQKKRKQIIDLKIFAEAERATEHPKVFTKVKFHYELVSPDAEPADLEHAVGLSIEKYCSASATLKRSGCDVQYESVVKRPEPATA
ncbi:MAG: OsmC family protein [Chloroherpetonaceae bacterium]|nr:OsmC family protein [Chloroherpetonaceae bacterium]MCS7211855.1 OsmC family protein [Chloroherpetonaceae bacterium]MDW8019623.1 OsmC family protein [Chloroherpetonaceae bacterium]MDW8466000.1 OsmC family protein [Chloroherpetonaceae bacterium]